MKLRSTSLLAVAALAASALAAGLPAAASAGAAPVSSVSSAAAPAAVSAAEAPLGEAAVAKARAHLKAKATDFALSQGEVDDLTVSSVVPTKSNGLTTVWFQQRHKSIPITNALINVAVRADGTILRVASTAVRNPAKLVTATSPKISDVAAAAAAARAVGLTPTGSFDSDSLASGPTRQRTLSSAGISSDPIPVQLAYELDGDGRLALTWQLVINQLDGEHWWQIGMDAGSGEEVQRYDWVAEDSHNVYQFPVEAPSFGGRSVATNPATTAASPFGWNDTNGAAGAESTLTIGNNVSAYTDTDANNVPDSGSSPDGGSTLTFNFPLDLTQPPASYKPAAVSNLYYANNRIHDVMYRFGFNEASANFQVNNYGKGQLGNDAVNAEAQDGSGTNNANFGTPPDGQRPRMQMYLWTLSTPGRDGDLDNGIIVHEYGHGISNRLTGGGTNVSCLQNGEQGGEGWSDYFSLVMTQPTSTEAAAGRGIGTYSLNQPTSGPGIRTKKYSTNFSVNDFTYDDIKSLAVPHGVGSVWATMLWDLNWAMVDEYGYSADLVTGNGGNVKALQLVIDGLKLNPCSPGFVDARDAILDADQADNGGANECLIWDVFARRGLGFSANQGSSNSSTDGTEAFDLPPVCLGLSLTASGSPDPLPGGSQITYTLGVENTGDTVRNGAVLTSQLGTTTTYVAGSATCGGTYNSSTRTVSFTINNLAPGDTRTCTLRAAAPASPVSSVRFNDDFEPDLSGWTATHASGTTVDWALSTAQSKSPTHSAFASEPTTVSDQYLTIASPLAIAAGDRLSFWHRYGFETGYDGGVVEVSTNGGSTWSDVGAAAYVTNGYDGAISGSTSSPIGGRQAFTGSAGWEQSVIDMAAYAGQSVLVRFRSATDSSVGATGWYVDDVSLGRVVEATNHVELAATGVPTQEKDIVTRIVGATATAPPAPTVTRTLPGPGAARVTFTSNGDGGSPITGYTAQCTSSDGGVTRVRNGAMSPIKVTGMTAGKQYRCRVRATNAVGSGPYSAYGSVVTVPSAPPAPTVVSTAIVPTGLRLGFTSNGDGGSAITSWTAQCTSSDGGATRSANGSASPITVTGLTSGKRYHCRARGTNAIGVGEWSAYGAFKVWTAP